MALSMLGSGGGSPFDAWVKAQGGGGIPVADSLFTGAGAGANSLPPEPSPPTTPAPPSNPAPTPAPTAGGGGGGGGGLPDYGGLITSDPIYQQTLGKVNAMSAEDAATRAAAIRRFLVQYGQVPDFASLGLGSTDLGYLNSDVNQSTRDLANQNTQGGTSIYARLQQAHTDAIRNIKNALAARGMLGSGETGWQLGKEDQSYKNNSFDAQNSLLDNVLGAITSYTQAGRQEQQMLIDALQAAAMRQMQMYQGGGGGGGGGAGDGSSADWNSPMANALISAASDAQDNQINNMLGSQGGSVYDNLSRELDNPFKYMGSI